MQGLPQASWPLHAVIIIIAMPFSISLKAYSKIILHCCKYPDKAVNGVVIGSVSKKDQSVQIQDAIPMFHLGLGLAPMLEVALTQVCVILKLSYPLFT